MVTRKTTTRSAASTYKAKAKAPAAKVKAKGKAKGKAKRPDDIFVWVKKHDSESASAPFMKGFVSIPESLIDSIQDMCFYDEERETYQLDIALWKQSGGVLRGSIQESWKNKVDDGDDEDYDDDDEDEYEDDEELDEDEDEDEDEEPTPVQRRASRRR